MKYFKIVFIGLIIALITSQSSVQAATFNKNRLIDNSLFTDTDSMSVAEIQQFLDDEGGSLLANWVDDVNMRRPSDNCVVHHATGMTAAQVIHEAATAWNAQVFNASGCAINGAYWGDPGYSNYTLPTVSPKVLLVTLQKEQSLISANGSYSGNPNDYKDPTCCSSNEYKLARAMGYGVPDSGPINEKYLGFYNQINWAAWQLRFNFERAAGNTSWDEVGYITYSGPMIEGTFRRCDSCSLQAFDGFYNIDGSPLYIENQATASLYYYTPHTYPPYNGNKNFVDFFSNWFGSVFADYKAKFHAQSGYPTIKQGDEKTVWMAFKNKGSTTWYDNVGKDYPAAPFGTSPVRLAAAKPVGRASDFGESWGTQQSRATGKFSAVYESDGTTLAADQHMAEPNQIAYFEFDLSVPHNMSPGTYRENFHPILEGIPEAMNELGAFLDITVKSADWNAKHVKQGGQPVMKQGYDKDVFVHYQNTGNMTWYDNVGKDYDSAPHHVKPVRLATKDLGRKSKFGATWAGSSQTRASGVFAAVYESDGTTLAADQHKVKPNQIARFEFDFLAPHNIAPNTYSEKFTPTLEGYPNKMNTLNTNWNVQVRDAQYDASFYSKSANPTISQGGTSTVEIWFQNNGNGKWYDGTSVDGSGAPPLMKAVKLATNNPLLHASDFGNLWNSKKNKPTSILKEVYESDGTTLASNQSVVKNGQIGVYEFDIKVKNNQPTGTYNLFVQPYFEGFPNEFNYLSSKFKVTVQ